jgi:hypothetical protein
MIARPLSEEAKPLEIPFQPISVFYCLHAEAHLPEPLQVKLPRRNGPCSWFRKPMHSQNPSDSFSSLQRPDPGHATRFRLGIRRSLVIGSNADRMAADHVSFHEWVSLGLRAKLDPAGRAGVGPPVRHKLSPQNRARVANVIAGMPLVIGGPWSGSKWQITGLSRRALTSPKCCVSTEESTRDDVNRLSTVKVL